MPHCAENKHRESRKGRGSPAGCDNCCSQSLRLSAIQRYCQDHPELQTYLKDPRNTRSPMRYILVSETHKVLLCTNTKAGSRLWGDTLVRSSSAFHNKYNGSDLDADSVYDLDDEEVRKKLRIFRLRDYSDEAFLNVLRNYFKVMVVRNPIERILSAYRDKFIYSPMGKGSLDGYNYVLRNYRKITTDEITTLDSRSMQGMAKITLAEFVRMVTDRSSPYNIHWDQYINNCHPCVINYDHIVRTETNNWDAVPVLDILSRGLDKNVLKHSVVSRDKEAVKQNMENPTFNKVLEEFSEVPQNDIINLMSYFKTDLEMFGYQFNSATLEGSCALINHTSMSVCC